MEIARPFCHGHNLRLDVFAEGVETVQQVALLKKLTANMARIYFSRPCPSRGPGIIAGDLKWQRASNQVAQQVPSKGNEGRAPLGSGENFDH